MKVIILCGGEGTRLKEETEYKPKPMVLVGGKPIIWHIMKLYSTYGFREFVLALGYKADYIKVNHLEGYEQYISERNLQQNFGFYSPSHYYISPQVLAAKYNPPLQGEAYCTENRGCTASIYQPSAVKFYGEEINGRYTGAIPATLSGTYFDHPQANMNIGYVTLNYAGYNNNNALQGYNWQIGSYARVAQQITKDDYIVGYY